MIPGILNFGFLLDGGLSVSMIRLIATILALAVLYFLYLLILKLVRKYATTDINGGRKKYLMSIISYLWLFIGLYILAYGLGVSEISVLERIVDRFDLDWDITKEGLKVFKISSLLLVLILIQVARLLDLIITQILEKSIRNSAEIKRKDKDVSDEEANRRTKHTIKYIVFGTVIMLTLKILSLDFALIDQTGDGDKPGITLHISHILQAVIIILLARLIISIVIHVFLKRIYVTKQIESGRQFALNQLFTYFVYIAATLFAFKSLGFNMTLLFGGLAALLVGIGLGLQQTFNDLLSGIILLFERSVEVGNVVLLGEDFVEVEKIGMRTCTVRDRRNVIRIIPNSRIVNEVILNPSHGGNKLRFYFELPVSHHTDPDLVKDILLQVAQEHEDVLSDPRPKVIFNDVTTSAFYFRLYYWTGRFVSHRTIESEMRWKVIRQFRIHSVELAHEQLDVHLGDDILIRDIKKGEIRINSSETEYDIKEPYKSQKEQSKKTGKSPYDP